MSAYYGTNATLRDQTLPSGKVGIGEANGRVRIAYDEWAVPAAVIAINSTVDLFELPKGARVLNAFVSAPDQGTTGTGKLGWLASPDLDSAGVTLEAADDDALVVSIDFKANAATTQGARTTDRAACMGHKMLGKVRAQLTITEAFDAGTGTICAWAFYVLD